MESIRDRMESDEIYLSFPFLFTFQNTGAIITRKQEREFRVEDCCYIRPGTNSAHMCYVDIVNASNIDYLNTSKTSSSRAN